MNNMNFRILNGDTVHVFLQLEPDLQNNLNNNTTQSWYQTKHN